MTGRYAADTTVPVNRSREEIERTLDRYGATAFHYSREDLPTGQAIGIEFRLGDHTIRLAMLLPSPTEKRFIVDTRGYLRSDNAAREHWEKACRQRWRALALVVKAKLEAIEGGITTLEEEFLSSIVVAGTDETVGQRLIPALRQRQQLPSLPTIEAKVIALPAGKTGSHAR
jgi:hypothetical protein